MTTTQLETENENNPNATDDDHTLQLLKGMAHRWRLNGPMNVLIDSGNGPEPVPPTDEFLKAAAKRLWQHLSPADQAAITAQFKFEEDAWAAFHAEHKSRDKKPTEKGNMTMTDNTNGQNMLTTAATDAARNILAATQNDVGFEKILKFNKGDYTIDKEPIAFGTEYVAHAEALTKSWIKFIDNKVADRKIYRSALGEVPCDRNDLDDLEKAGTSEDSWTLQYLLPMENITTGELAIFTTGSVGGHIGVSELCSTYAKRVIAGRSGLPKVKLGAAEMKTKNFGAVPRPKFEIVGWDDGEPDTAMAEIVIPPTQPATTKATGKSADMDDEIPF